MPPVYLDHAATTQVDESVLAAMLPAFREAFGNPASRGHAIGRRASKAVDDARFAVATLIGARSMRDILFTSGATEANNLALSGLLRPGAHLITARTEHKSVLDTALHLTQHGVTVTVLDVQPDGRVDPAAVAAALRPETALVSLMLVNNETGARHPIEAISPIVQQAGVPLHVDGTQAVGQLPVEVQTMGIDLLSLSGHKLYGPMGVGALYIRREVRRHLVPMLRGGAQEGGTRAGTLNVPGIVGLGAACQLATDVLPATEPQIRHLRQRLWAGLKPLGRVHRQGPTDEAALAPGILNVAFEGADRSAVLPRIPELAVSGGSACTEGSLAISHVLDAMGVSAERAKTVIRFSLGRHTTAEAIDFTIDRMTAAVQAVRQSDSRHRDASPRSR
ncbi:MAG: cysteine desulfurase family protein [Myxococcota bacterium]